jgi:hypothetical protein
VIDEVGGQLAGKRFVRFIEAGISGRLPGHHVMGEPRKLGALGSCPAPGLRVRHGLLRLHRRVIPIGVLER